MDVESGGVWWCVDEEGKVESVRLKAKSCAFYNNITTENTKTMSGAMQRNEMAIQRSSVSLV